MDQSKKTNTEQEQMNTEPDLSETLDKPSTESPITYPTRSELEDQLTAMENKVNEFKEKFLRAHADVENMRLRMEREIGNAHKYGVERLIKDLLPAIDSLTRGLEGPVATSNAEAKKHYEGMRLTVDMLEKILARHGVEEISPEQGEGFNPQLHEAMGMQENSGFAANAIVQVLQKGYQLHGRVLRAAMVMVAK